MVQTSRAELNQEVARLRRRVAELEAAKAEERRKLSTLLANLPGMAYRCRNDPDWTMEIVSEGCLPLTGYPPEDLIGNRAVSYAELIHPEDRGGVRNEVQAALRKREPFRITYRIRKASGEERWVWEQGVGVFDAGGDLAAIEGFITDVTDRRRALEELEGHRDRLEATVLERTRELVAANERLSREAREREQAEAARQESDRRTRAIFDQTFQFIGLLTPDGVVVEANRTALEFAGVPASEVLGRPFWETPWWSHSPELQERLRRAVADVAHGEFVRFEATHPAKTGGVAYVDFSLKPIRDESGEVVFLIPEGRDITDKKKAEEDLRASEERLQAILDASPALIFVKDRQGRYTLVNRNYERLFHLERDEVVGKTDNDIFPAHLAEAYRRNDTQVLRSGEAVQAEEEVVQEDGLHSYSSLRFPLRDPNGEITAVCGISTDVTDRRRAEEAAREREALRESERRFRELADLLPETVVETNTRGRITFLNKRGLDLFGYAPSEVAGGLSVFRLFDPEDRERAKENTLRRLRGEPIGVSRYTAVRRDGQRFPVLVHSSLVARGEEVTGHRGVIVDVSELHKAEQERLRLAAAVEQAGEAIVICDPEGKIQYVNPAFEKITGYSRGEATGRSVVFTNLEDGEPEVLRDLREALAHREPWAGQLLGRKKDGLVYEEECTLSPVREPSGKIANHVVVCRDVTERSRLERQFRQVQKLEALGTLAGGIAHDFNNVLMPIIGYTQLTLDDLPAASDAAENLERVLAAAERAKDFIGQILAFSREAEQPRRALRVTPVIKETLKLMSAALPKTVQVRSRMETKDDLVRADPTRLHQILVNLCTNAGLAMEGKTGVLEVSLEDEEVDSAQLARYLGLQQGSYLRLKVSDTGCGMTREVMERIFEPFFTTRAGRGGTGLGLAAVHGIVNGLGGAIRVYSEPGHGTTFHLYLPKARGHEEPAAASTGPVPTGNERVLLVDDEEAIVDMSAKLLTDLGYRVVATTSSTEAYRLFQAQPHDFDVVVTDQTMPTMTGRSLLQRIRRLRPEIPAILMTGFSRTVSDEDGKDLADVPCLTKPLGRRELAAAVRAALDKKR